MPGRLTCAALVAAAAAAAGAAVQEPPRPTSRVDANYVRVDMYATHRDGPVEDLHVDEVDLLEDGVRQEIERFEYVRVRPSVAPELRRDQASPSDSGVISRDPRVRVLVVFLDTFHVRIESSHDIRQRLIDLLEATVGDDDLVGLMHPHVSARRLTLGPKITVISNTLTTNWTWAERYRDTPLDPIEQRWFACYGPGDRFEEMRARRRETMTLDALSDLVRRLRGLREERKAVLLVSEGWPLFGHNRRLAAPAAREIQSSDPRTDGGASSDKECDAARIRLAFADNTRRLRDLAGEANRANVTFYTVHPAGLQVAGSSSYVDQLKKLAANTDGLAVLNANDVAGAIRRIVSDLTSYYLLGFQSANTKTDGTFREIQVRVKRPGVHVRARRGYRALTREEADALRAAMSRSTGGSDAPASAAVSGIPHRPDEIVNPVNLASLRHVVLWKRGPATGREYVASEDTRFRRTDRLRLEHAADAAGTATARILDANGNPMILPVQVSERPDLSGNYRWIVTDVALAPLAPGEYAIELAVGDLKVHTQFQIIP